jgi:AcrR family transcriptional regulator
VLTPWGEIEELRRGKLLPGAGTPREEVKRNQRERLLGAMVASVGERGYEASTVADLLRLSGVSRATFYEHFRDKEECLLATFEAIVATTMEALGGQLERGGEAAAQRGLRRLLELIAAQPAAARLCFNDAYLAGKAGHAAVEQTMASVTALIAETLAKLSGRRLPEGMARGLVGGGQRIIQNHLVSGEAAALPGLAPDLWDWGLGYEPPPQPLRLSGRRPRRPGGSQEGTTMPPFAAMNQGERIVRGLARAAAECGYQAVTVAEIAARAAVSQATFYSHFGDKDTAMLAALDSAGSQMLAAMMPAGRRAADWPHGVRASIGALCTFCAAEPDLAWLTAVEVYAAGGPALEQRDRVIVGMRETLAPGFELAPQRKPIIADAIVGAVSALLYMQIVEAGPEKLPEIAPLASYMVLAPFIGAEQAAEIANGDGRGGR